MVMKRLAALLVFVVLAAPAVARAEPEARSLPWTGILPSPEAAADAEYFVCRVLDGRTREPVVGARWIRTPEWIAPWRVRHDAVLGVATTDREGVAHLPTTPAAWIGECHWLVVASGYGAAHEYGKLPPSEVLLEPADRVVGRVVDRLGRPVAGARVDVLGGCSHGTAAASGLAAEDGRFLITGVDPGLPGQLWVEGRGIAADLLALDSPESLGTAGVLLAMEPGLTYVGRVVDLLGAPVSGAVIRVYNEQRGPATRTDAEGRFVLEGAEPDGDLLVFPPADLTESEGASRVEDAHPGISATIMVSPVGVVEHEPTAKLRVRAQAADGSPEGMLAFRLVHVSTGRGPTGTTAEAGEDEDLAEGEAIEEVRSGAWRVLPAEPFDTRTFDPIEVDARDGETQEVVLTIRPQSRLKIEGDVPAAAMVTLAVEGATLGLFDDEPDAAPWLPTRGPAALCVEIDGRPPFFFPVSPASEGVRTVRVDLPEPRIVVLPDGARYVKLLDGERDAYAFTGDDPAVLLTDAVGPLLFSWDAPDDVRREAQLILPQEEGARLVIDASTARVVHAKTVVRALAPDGTVFDECEESPGTWAELYREGWRTLYAVAPPSGEVDVQWGSCTLRLEIRDEDGPVDALALIGGEVHAAPKGILEIRGLAAGSLRVVVGRRDEVAPGRELELVLDAGKTRTQDVLLPID